MKKIFLVIGIIILITIVFIGYSKITNPFFSCQFNPSGILSDCASCMGSCYSKIAYEKNDIKICDRISKNKAELKNNCTIAIATKRNDPLLCNNMIVAPELAMTNNKDEFIDSCLYNIATTNKDSSVCNIIKKKEFKESCYRNLKIK